MKPDHSESFDPATPHQNDGQANHQSTVEQQEPENHTKRQNPSQSQPQTSRSQAEWVSFSVASLLLTSVIGIASYLWLNEANGDPPQFEIRRQGEIRQAAGQYYVPFQVTNSGDQTAESVRIMAELQIGDSFRQTGEQQIDFLSSQEVEAGAFIFTRNPQDGELTLRVTGYKLP